MWSHPVCYTGPRDLNSVFLHCATSFKLNSLVPGSIIMKTKQGSSKTWLGFVQVNKCFNFHNILLRKPWKNISYDEVIQNIEFV